MSHPDAQAPTAANGKIGGPLTQRMRKKIDDGGFETPTIAKASSGTSVRTDQTGTRLPPVPVAGRRESAGRVAMICTAHNLLKLFTSQGA